MNVPTQTPVACVPLMVGLRVDTLTPFDSHIDVSASHCSVKSDRTQRTLSRGGFCEEFVTIRPTAWYP